MYKVCGDNIMRKCVPYCDSNSILAHHDSIVGGILGLNRLLIMFLNLGFIGFHCLKMLLSM